MDGAEKGVGDWGLRWIEECPWHESLPGDEQLPVKVYIGLFQGDCTVDIPFEEWYEIELDGKMSCNIWRFEEKDGHNTNTEATLLLETIWGAHKCFLFCNWEVLMSDGHLVAYESRKLQDREDKYQFHEKEMIVILRGHPYDLKNIWFMRVQICL